MTFQDFNLSKNPDGLLPVVIQDADTLRVLMLGYMNAEAFQKTQETCLVTFYSRSRQTLWTKGETSNNYLHVVEMYADCDADTLLIKAVPDGPTCHRGTTACWDTPEAEGFLYELERCVQDRHKKMPLGSYTTYLFEKGLNRMAQKVGEEAVETIIEATTGNRAKYIEEASDLFYHLLVLNEQVGVTLADLQTELLSRHKK
jgi:phosphoribosyl-ATP pyrophosphohydrolase/phosphoribosyl-AMP cyclohydrolase